MILDSKCDRLKSGRVTIDEVISIGKKHIVSITLNERDFPEVYVHDTDGYVMGRITSFSIDDLKAIGIYSTAVKHALLLADKISKYKGKPICQTRPEILASKVSV